MPNKTCYIINNIISRLFAAETRAGLAGGLARGVKKIRFHQFVNCFYFAKITLSQTPT